MGVIVGFTRLELMKLLKGLHYSMWMQDKPLLQVSLNPNTCSLNNELYFKYFPESLLKAIQDNYSRQLILSTRGVSHGYTLQLNKTVSFTGLITDHLY